MVLEKTLESPLDCKEIQPVHSKGDQSWVFFGRNNAEAETPVFWPPCREPAWEFPPMAKIMRRVLVGKANQNSRGAPLGLPERLPQNQNLFYNFTTFTNSSDINGGLSPLMKRKTTFLCKKINLKL